MPTPPLRQAGRVNGNTAFAGRATKDLRDLAETKAAPQHKSAYLSLVHADVPRALEYPTAQFTEGWWCWEGHLPESTGHREIFSAPPPCILGAERLYGRGL